MGRVSGLIDRHPSLRWVAPTAAIAVVAAAAVVTAGAASADEHPALPPISAEQLLTDALQPTTQSLSGTATVTADLGLPDVSGLLSGAAAGGSGVVPGGAASIAPGSGSTSAALTGLAGLLTGSHTVRVWVDGPEKSRVAVITQGGESDVIHNGTDLWLWQSAGQQVLHATLPAKSAADAQKQLTPAQQQKLQQKLQQELSKLPSTPQQAAQELLAAAGPSTDFTVDSTASIAGRSAYRLVATPKDPGSLVDRVVISIDSETHVPLKTEVYSTQRTAPAFSVGYTDVTFAAPSADVFAFTPPAGSTVKEAQKPTSTTEPTKPATGTGTKPDVTTSGKGWATVVVTKAPAGAPTETSGAGSALSMLTPVSGSWGSGHALSGTLFSVLITDKGTIAVGAVPVETLEAAVAGSGQ